MSWFNGENLATSFGQIASKVQTLTEKALLDNHLDEQLEKLKQENQNLKLFLKKLHPNEETVIEELNKFQNELQIVETLKLELEKKGKECKEKEDQLAKIKTMAADKIKRQKIEIQDLQNQLNKSTVTDIETELKKQRVQFAESYGQLEAEKDDLCEKMILLEQELAQIRANDTAGKLEELQDMICTLRAESTGLKQENLLLKQNNNHQNTEPLESILEIRGALDAANKQNEILSREIVNKESTIQKSSQEIEMLKSENNILKSNAIVFDQEKGDLEVKLKESCKVLEDAQLKLQEKDQHIKGLNATLDQIEHYSSDIENLKNEIDSIMQEKQDLAMSLESSSKEALESSQELQKAREAVQSFKIKLKESNNKTNALLADIETLRDSLKQKIEEVNLLKNDLEKLRMISDNTKDSTNILDSESEVITELRIRLNGINNENQNLRNEIEALLDSKSRELSSVNQDLYTAIDKIDVLTQELKDSKSESLDLKQKIESLKTSNTNDELLSLKQKLESLERENDALNISIQKSLEESFELKKELDSINIAAAERSISNSKGFQQINAENLNLKNEIERLNELLENAKKDLKELTAKLVTKNDESDNEKGAEISYLQGKNVELEEKIILLQSQINEKEQELISANEAASYLKELNSQYKLNLKDSNDTGRDQLTALKEELSQQIEYGKMMEKSCFDLKSLYDNLTQENNALSSDLNEYQEKMEHIKSAVGVKLKASLEEAAKLRGLLAQSNEENENLMKQVQDLSDSLSAAASNDTKEELQYLQNKLAELVASLQKSEIELSRLREYLVEVEEASTQEILSMQSTMDEYKYQIQTLERERDEWHSMTENDKNDMQNTASMLDKSKSEIDQLLTKIHTLEIKGKSDQQTIQNLQNVLAQFEASKQREIQEAVYNLDKTIKELSIQLEECKEKSKQTDNLLSENKTLRESYKSLQKEEEEKGVLVGQLRHDVIQLQTHLSEAMRLIRKGSADESVDRKLVSNLIIGFITAEHGSSKRYEILSLISSILKLDDSEKAKVGLIRHEGAKISPRSSQVKGKTDNFTDMWISFLERETDKDDKQSPNLANLENPPKEPEIKPENRRLFGFF